MLPIQHQMADSWQRKLLLKLKTHCSQEFVQTKMEIKEKSSMGSNFLVDKKMALNECDCCFVFAGCASR